MNKSELIAAVAKSTGVSKKNCDLIVNSVLDTIEETLKKEEKVVIVGFGSFESRTRAARTGINPLTKQEIQIPETKVPAFKAGKSLKDALNNK